MKNEKSVKNNSADGYARRGFMSGGVMLLVAILLAAVLVFSGVFGSIVGVRYVTAAAMYEGVAMDTEVLSFFATYYKGQYIRILQASGVDNASDSFIFWSSEYEDGKTYGDALKEATLLYIKKVLVAAKLFDTYTSLTDEGDELIQYCVDQVVEYKGGGSVESFNASVDRYGFSYDSFKRAAKILYKATYAQSIIYGTDGLGIKERPGGVSEYLSTYSHVKLLFIRTEDEFMVDENGNRVPGEDGDALRPLTDKEKAERAASISAIRESIKAYEEGRDGQMSPEYFSIMLDKYDSASEVRHEYGYYFNASSTYTVGFADTVSEDVVKKALSMKVGEYAEVSLDYGICFIYKYDVEEGANEKTGLEIYFEDFYTNAATYFFEDDISILSVDVVIKDKYNELDLIFTPYNPTYIPRFESEN